MTYIKIKRTDGGYRCAIFKNNTRITDWSKPSFNQKEIKSIEAKLQEEFFNGRKGGAYECLKPI